MTEILDQVGIAGAVTAYHSERNGGKLTLIDGHERKDHPADWPTLILDVTDEEADLLLAILDPMRQMAETDPRALEDLLARAKAGTVGLDELLGNLARSMQASADDDEDGAGGLAKGKDAPGPPEMELQPFEHLDYVVLLFRNSLDWAHAVDKLGLGRVAFTQKDGKSKKVGLGRVVDGAKVMKLLEAKQDV